MAVSWREMIREKDRCTVFPSLRVMLSKGIVNVVVVCVEKVYMEAEMVRYSSR